MILVPSSSVTHSAAHRCSHTCTFTQKTYVPRRTQRRRIGFSVCSAERSSSSSPTITADYPFNTLSSSCTNHQYIDSTADGWQASSCVFSSFILFAFSVCFFRRKTRRRPSLCMRMRRKRTCMCGTWYWYECEQRRVYRARTHIFLYI